jgi:hypothetical protein
MAENPSDLDKGSERRVGHDLSPEKADSDNKRQSGRPPTRPPCEQYTRAGKFTK